ncbi:voltage-dependent anion channel-domain-containing protein [Pseudoneurospora amorphoporcata]|uniref:Voltage-dependent anion channel-domain-containing protein n=1 Tax=Pseudoneurospora amorphoporcata TaxID=241081 RepID=A0AAN6NVE2_9PEZI|nr:voltage-dependent anion channel-domain-containing protein [Pseudoneurospora amorphoporcata]
MSPPRSPFGQTGAHVIFHDTDATGDNHNPSQNQQTQQQQQQQQQQNLDPSFLALHTRQSSCATVTGEVDPISSRTSGTYAGTPGNGYEKEGREGRSTDYISGGGGRDFSLKPSAVFSQLALNASNKKQQQRRHNGHIMTGATGHLSDTEVEEGTNTPQLDLNKGYLDFDPYDPSRPKLSFRARLKHFTWAWYTLCMSTGGLSLLIANQPHSFRGLHQIGLAVYIINLIIFVSLTSLQIARFVLHPGTCIGSVAHVREGFFFPTFFLSMATVITSTQKYCVPIPGAGGVPSAGLVAVLHIFFWIYLVLATVVAVAQYSFLFSQKRSFRLNTMMPTWILPIFPVMLSGTIAAVISPFQPASRAVVIVCAGLTCQGLGVCVAFMMYAHMIGRLMVFGLPSREHRPGLFMCVGPPSFTVVAFLGMAGGLPKSFDYDMDGLTDSKIIYTMALMAAVFLWALAFWWFFIGVFAVLASRPKYFHLGWWASVFPNTGFTLATISIGNAFRSEAVRWVATAMSICMVCNYLFVLSHHIRAVVVQDICYPGRDEDVEEVEDVPDM